MADPNRISGTMYADVDGTQLEVVGDWTYNIHKVKRETLLGKDKIHGYKEVPKENFIEGEARDSSSLDLAALFAVTNSTIRLQLANGKDIVLRNAWYAGDGDVGAEEANIQIRYEGMSGEEV